MYPNVHDGINPSVVDYPTVGGPLKKEVDK